MPHDIQRVPLSKLPPARQRTLAKLNSAPTRWAWKCKRCGRTWEYVIVVNRFGCPKVDPATL